MSKEGNETAVVGHEDAIISTYGILKHLFVPFHIRRIKLKVRRITMSSFLSQPF
jgi:hypothetical protein